MILADPNYLDVTSPTLYVLATVFITILLVLIWLLQEE